MSACVLAAVRSKYWRSRLRPPTNIAAPMTSRMFPRIEPTSEALTTSCRPSRNAKKAMMISGALPNVTLRKPPMPGPDRAASSSVARPINAAVGMTPTADVTKMIVALACATSSAIAIGMKGTSRYGQPCPLRRNRRACVTRGRLGRQQVRALAGLVGVAARVLDALRVLLEVLRVRAARPGPAGGGRPAEQAAQVADQLLERLGVLRL